MADFKILGKLGEGGMGIVYRALQAKLNREVAIKVLSDDLSQNATYVSRFKREVKACTQLTHPNIIKVLDFGISNGQLFYVMELVEGKTLRALMEESAPMKLENVIPLLEQLFSALEYCHERGIIHRDIKPGNIMVRSFAGPGGGSAPHVTLMDFGLVKTQDASTILTKAGKVLGTPLYMAPEIFTGGGYTPASDIWAVGVILFEMLTGEKLYTDVDLVALVQRIVQAPMLDFETVLPDLPQGYRVLLEKCLEKDVALRYPDGGSATKALARLREAGPQTPLAARQAARTTRKVPSATPILTPDDDRPVRGPLAFVILGMILGALLTAMAFTLSERMRQAGQADASLSPAVASPTLTIKVLPGSVNVAWKSDSRYKARVTADDNEGSGPDSVQDESLATDDHHVLLVGLPGGRTYTVLVHDGTGHPIASREVSVYPIEELSETIRRTFDVFDSPRLIRQYYQQLRSMISLNVSDKLKKVEGLDHDWARMLKERLDRPEFREPFEAILGALPLYFSADRVTAEVSCRSLKTLVEFMALVSTLKSRGIEIPFGTDGIWPDGPYGPKVTRDFEDGLRPALDGGVLLNFTESDSDFVSRSGLATYETVFAGMQKGLRLQDLGSLGPHLRSGIEMFHDGDRLVDRWVTPEPISLRRKDISGALYLNVEVRELTPERYLLVETSPDGKDFLAVAVFHESMSPTTWIWYRLSPSILGEDKTWLAVRPVSLVNDIDTHIRLDHLALVHGPR